MSADFQSAQAQRGWILLQQGRYADAERYFRDALAEDPNNPANLHGLALCQVRLGQEKAALETVGRAIAAYPFESALFALKAQILTHLHREKEAHAAADKAIAQDPHSTEGYVAKALVFSKEMKWSEAEALARRALAIEPEDSTAASILANALRFQNRLGESADQISYMLARDPESDANHANAGWVALQRNDHRKAEEHFLEALRLDPESEYAKEGLKEAYRARSPVYRAYLNYCFFMQRFTAQKQFALMIGLLVIVNLAPKLFRGPTAFIGTVIIIAYFLFVFWVHVARATGNLLLVLDKFARHALNRAESIEAVAVGGGVLLGLPLLIVGLVTKSPAMTVGATLLGTAFPLAYVFTNPSNLGKLVFGAAAAFVFCVGVLVSIQELVPGRQFGDLSGAVIAALYTVVAVTWFSNVPSLRR